jgi:hypothetical protein
MLQVRKDDNATLGVLPSASAAERSKRALAENTLLSARALVDGLVEGGFATRADLSRAGRAVERLEALLGATERPGEVVEPSFHEWYFRAIDHLKHRRFTGSEPLTINLTFSEQPGYICRVLQPHVCRKEWNTDMPFVGGRRFHVLAAGSRWPPQPSAGTVSERVRRSGPLEAGFVWPRCAAGLA